MSTASTQMALDYVERIAAKAQEAREDSGHDVPKADARESREKDAAGKFVPSDVQTGPGVRNGSAEEKEETRHRAILRAPSRLPPETEDLCATCGKTAQRYAAFRDGKVWRLVCRACHDAAYQPLGPVPCSGCNAPARVVTMLNGRVICAACQVRP